MITENDMKPTELRIGNLVMYNGEVVRVEQITKKKIGYHRHKGETRMNYARLFEIEPIPITEELLLKIGFKKDVDANSLYRYAIDNCLFEVRLWDSGILIKLENYCEDCVRKVHLPKTPNLHQLQNAYYLATGKELEIEL